MKRFCAVFVFSFLFCAFGHSQARADELTPQKRADIRKLMVITGAAKIGVQFADAMMQSLTKTLKATRPDIPDRVFAVMQNELVSLFQEKMEAPNGLIDQVIPIYDRYLTHSEISELLAFYQTDLGRKVIDILPKVTSESMAAGQAWGQSLGPEIAQRLQEALKREGIQIPNK